MVQSVTPDDDCKILEKEIKAKRFAYSKDNAKKNPWAKFGNDNNEHIVSSHQNSFTVNNNDGAAINSSDFPKPSEFKGRSLNSYMNFSRTYHNTNDENKSSHMKGFSNSNSNVLAKNWSIKNMPFSLKPDNKMVPTPTTLGATRSSQTTCISPPSKFPSVNTSYYSRHKLGGSTGPSPLASNVNSLTSVSSQPNVAQRTWTTKQTNFSYAANTTTTDGDGNDADDEFDHSSASLVNIMKNKQRMSDRPVSGRTKKAGKLHDAYLRSRGMGNYTTAGTNNNNNNNNNNNDNNKVVRNNRSYDKENDGDDEADSMNEFT